MDEKMIKSPKHYTEGRKFEPKDVIRDWGLNFNLGNAVKYLARAGRKGDAVDDLKKAQQYIQFEIDAIVAERNRVAGKKEPNNNYSVKPVFEAGDIKALVVEIGVEKGIDLDEVMRAFLSDLLNSQMEE